MTAPASAGTFHSKEDWTAIRPHFVRLYIDEGRKLKDVIRLLKVRHGFEATSKQCKDKITEWKLSKKNKEHKLLHVVRKLKCSSNQQGHRSVRLYGRNISMQEVMKHFNRKSIMNEDELLNRLPNSPTPSVISCTEILIDPAQSASKNLCRNVVLFQPSTAIVSSPVSVASPYPIPLSAATGTQAFNSTDDQLHTGETSSQYQSLNNSLPLTKALQSSYLEQSLRGLTSLVEGSIQHLARNDLVWHAPVSEIYHEMTEAAWHLRAGNSRHALVHYDRVLHGTMQIATLPVANLLHFITNLLQWSTYSVYGAIVESLLMFLTNLKSPKHNPILVTIARSLVGQGSTSKHIMLTIQQCIADLTCSRLAPGSLTIIFLLLRLSQKYRATSDFDAARNLLRRVQQMLHDYDCLMDLDFKSYVDIELGVALYDFGDSSAALWYFDGFVRYCIQQGPAFDGSKFHSMLWLATCNFRLGHIELACSQAEQTVIGFVRIYGKEDPRTHAAMDIARECEEAWYKQMASMH